MNIFALYILIMSLNLFLLLAFFSRILMKPELLVKEFKETSKYISKAGTRGSRKKREIVSAKVSLVRKKVFTISMMAAIIPVIGMMLMFFYLSVFLGEYGLATRSLCSLPYPIELFYEGQCLIYTPWIIFLSYVLILPLYNHFSGIDLLKEHRE